jgi:hypothetical protein
MKEFPPVPRAADAPADLFASGHLWLQEYVDGLPLRFSLEESGLVVFGDEETTSRTESMPLPVQHAVRHVRDRLDRDALREAVPAVESITFFGVATTHRVIAYDWDRTPSFLGVDVWSGSRERYLPPDTVEKIFERLDLHPVNAFRKEVRAVDFDPSAYEVPQSAWYDGPAAGALVRSKTGGRAKLLDPAFEAATADPLDVTAAEAAERFVTDARVETAAAALEATGAQVGTDAVIERVLEAVVRERHGRLAHDETPFDLAAFRSAVAAAVQRKMGSR